MDPESESSDAASSGIDNNSSGEETKAEYHLSSIEARILGALMEKQLSTPDAYPLTVNSLLSACNQKSNRDPVSNYQKGEAVRTLRELESRALVRYEMGARSERYEQRFTHKFSLSKKQQALIAMMMLRGPQTSNELYTRTQRLHEYTDREDMQVSLERLTQGELPFVVLIPKGPGQREDRYGHVLCGTPQMPEAPAQRAARSTNSAPVTELDNAKLVEAKLVEEVALLRRELDALYALTGHNKAASD